MPRLAMPWPCLAELILAVPCLCHTIPIATDLCCSFAMPFSSMPSLCPSRQFLAMPLPLIPPQIVTSPFHCVSSPFYAALLPIDAIPSMLFLRLSSQNNFLLLHCFSYLLSAIPSPVVLIHFRAMLFLRQSNPVRSSRCVAVAALCVFLRCQALAVHFQSPRFGALPSRLVSRLIFAFP